MLYLEHSCSSSTELGLLGQAQQGLGLTQELWDCTLWAGLGDGVAGKGAAAKHCNHIVKHLARAAFHEYLSFPKTSQG